MAGISSSAVETIEIDDDDGLPSPPVAAALAASAAAAAAPQVVDLCHPSYRRANKKQRCKSVASASARTDAIDVDNVAHQHSTYRQLLGPLRFEFCLSFHKHFFEASPAGKISLTSLYQELVEYQLNLPIEQSSSIFVRATETRMDLLRVMITGPTDTPYAFGCFVFDVYLPDYPHKPPSVRFLTTGGGQVRFNPNLYQCGKVCLSLLGTWTGPGWVSNKSTLLQVLVSIQGLILVEEPYYNEPGYQKGHHFHDNQAGTYTRNIRKYTLLHAILQPLKQQAHYPEFQAVIKQHFVAIADLLEAQMTQWLKEDRTLQSTIDTIRGLLKQLQNDENKKPAAVSGKSKASEIVVLID